MKVTLVTQLTSMHEVMNFWRVWSTTSWMNPPMQLWRSLMVQQSLQVHHHFVNALHHLSTTAPTSLQWSLPVPLKELYIRYNINTSTDVTPQYKQRLHGCIGLTPIDMVSLLASTGSSTSMRLQFLLTLHHSKVSTSAHPRHEN